MSRRALSSEPPTEPSSAPAAPPPEPGRGAAQPSGSAWLRGSTLVVLGMLLGTVASTVATCAYHATRPAPSVPETTTIVRSTPDVITAVRDLARLESTSFHVERVIDLTDRQTRFAGLITADDAILLVAAGDVVAGVDLREMSADDIVIDAERKTARLTLPPPRVLSTRLDNERTYVHTRRTDTLARRHEDLETRARREAESTLMQSAVTAGILPRARSNAARTVESLVRALGYERVDIVWRDEE